MRRLCLLLIILALCTFASGSFAGGGEISVAPHVLRPGKAYEIVIQAPAQGEARLRLADASGETAAIVVDAYPVQAGDNSIAYDGMMTGEIPVPEGEYTLCLSLDGGEETSVSMRVGAPYPLLTHVMSTTGTLGLDESATVTFQASVDGTVRIELRSYADDIQSLLAQLPVSAGQAAYTWDGTLDGAPVADGDYALVFTLSEGNAMASMSHYVMLEVQRTVVEETSAEQSALFVEVTPTPVPTPSPTPEPTPAPTNAPYSQNAKAGSFWALTPGETDDAKIWEALTQPIVVYDGGLDAAAKTHAYLMENPDGTGEMVAQLHAQSQGLNVIGEENEHGYVLVEAFSNYDEDYNPVTEEEKAEAFDVKRGYVKASALKTVEVNQEYGILIDKLTQRLYLYHNGERVTEMLVATGLIQDEKYYCETIPGEYITISRTGGFWSGNMYCDMAIRINGGILLHEVPCKIRDDGSHDYSSFEGYLGTKQSHGCIRIQRLKNEDGYNHAWLWNNLPLKTRVIIWDDLNRVDSPTTWYPNP